MGREAKAAARGPKAALVTDSSVAALYLEPALESLRAARLEATSAVVPPGEGSKTLARAG